MEERDVLELLLELCGEVDLRVRIAGGDAAAGDGPPLASGICRVRGEWWVVLSRVEPASAQIRTLARALRNHGGPRLEQRYLPPAVRELLEREAPVG